MSNKNFGGKLNGKGYYIALILCAAAIGISGYMYYRSANDNPSQLQTPDVTAGATTPLGSDGLPVVATQAEPAGIQGTTPAPAVSRKPIKTVSPVEGQVVAAFSMDALSYNPTTRDWRVHNGMDITAEEGTEVCAAADGTVYTVYEDDTMGHTVVIRHEDGYVTMYASLGEETAVKAGDTVTAGQKIGTVGCSALLESAIGHHVHFSVSHNDVTMDPGAFLAQE